MDIRAEREKEFKELVDRFATFIKVHIMRYGVYRYGLDPDDIAQEVKLKIWRLLLSEKTIVNYTSYIRKIVSSSVIDQIRKFRREEGIYDIEKEKQVAEAELIAGEDFARFRDLEDVLRRAVDGLIESRRQVVKLYLLNLSIPEISSFLKWSPDKTRNLLYRGLADLKNKLKDMDKANGKKR